MAAMIGLFAQNGHGDIGLGQILMITFPACLIGVILGSIICVFFGKDLKNDPAYQARLKAGLVLPPEKLSDRSFLLRLLGPCLFSSVLSLSSF